MNRSLRIVAWILGIVLFGFFALGGFAYELVIGLDWTAYPFGRQIQWLFETAGLAGNNAMAGVFYIVIGMILIGTLTGRAVRRSGSGEPGSTDVGRRRALAIGAGVGASVLATGAAVLRAGLGWGRAPQGWIDVNGNIQAKVPTHFPEHLEEWKGARVDPDTGYRRLGRTGWRIFDVVLGSGRVGRLEGSKGVDIIKLALDRGVNYIDTSPDYSATGSETVVGEAVQGRRDQVFLATKFCTPWGHLGAGTSVSEYKRVIEESLTRLRTDYADLAHVHACDSVGRLMDENLHEAFDRLKEEGKVHNLGFSSHTPNLVEVTETAIGSGRFDVMMLAYHHGAWPAMPGLIDRAHEEQDMGVIAMKTLKGAKHQNLADFQQSAPTYSQAALKWVLSNPSVSAAVISFFEFQHVDEYLRASGQPLSPEDVALLEGYDRQIVGTYCTPHCGACLSSCPEQLAIHDILRHRMYFEDYGDEKEAMRLYAQLEKNASVCAGCAAPCAGSCPVGIPIQERLTGAHDLLTLTLT